MADRRSVQVPAELVNRIVLSLQVGAALARKKAQDAQFSDGTREWTATAQRIDRTMADLLALDPANPPIFVANGGSEGGEG